MRNSKFSTRQPYAERVEISLTTEQKRRAFELADKQNMSVGAVFRQAFAQFADGDQRRDQPHPA